VGAKLAEDNARVTAAGPAAGTDKPQAENPLGQALAEKLAQDNARTVAGTAAGAAVRDSAEAVQQGGRAAGEALRQGAEAGAEVARRAGEAGADAVRRGAEVADETFRRGAQAVAESQRQIVQDAAQRMEEVSRKVAEAARGTTENVRRFLSLPNSAEGGLRDLQQGVTSLVEGVVQTNLRAAREVFRLADPAPFVELQQRFAREYTDAVLQNSAVLVRAVRRTADEALRPLEQEIEHQQQEQRQREPANQNQGQPGFETAAE
jgi:Phasin protein